MKLSSKPAAAASSWVAAKNTRAGRAQKIAPRHMGHGSHELYSSHPESWKSPSVRQASRMATTSACAVGSLSRVTWLLPVAMTMPSLTTTAPNGPPPRRTLARSEEHTSELQSRLHLV